MTGVSHQTMGILEDELAELKCCVPRIIADSTLETCVPEMVRVNIQRSQYKQIVVCFQFPNGYPDKACNVELKSRHVSEKLLDGLSRLCEDEMKKNLGKPQVLKVLRFVRQFIDDNPLCCCSEEISRIKTNLEANSDELKLRQKTSSVTLKVSEGPYYTKYNVFIPDDYPDKQVSVEERECNYPPVIRRWFLAQSTEIARQCVEPPLKKSPKDPPFVRQASLEPVVTFLTKEAHAYPKMNCAVCSKKAFPADPKDVEHSESGPFHVERLYCGHIYHYKCLDTYINMPPFQGGKKCHMCGHRIYHERWKLRAEVAEARWAHKQAKMRELDEVADFLS